MEFMLKIFSPNVFKFAFFACLITIEFLATTSRQVVVNELFWDKINHAFAFFVLFILANFGFKIRKIWIIFWLIIFGLQIEIVQSFLPKREFSLLDIIADFIGICIGFFSVKFYELWRKNGKIKTNSL